MANEPPTRPIMDEELLHSVAALTNAAHTYRSILLKIVDDELADMTDLEKENSNAVKTLMEHEALLRLSDRIINSWLKQLGIED